MKPTWDRLMEEFKDSKTALVADVDCTVHEDVCSKHGVEGYPTIKYGDPGALQDYEGGREFEELLEFAKTNLGPTCGLKNLDLCSEEQKKEIETVNAMTDEQLVKGIEEKDAAIAEREKSSKPTSRPCRRVTTTCRRRRMLMLRKSRSLGSPC